MKIPQVLHQTYKDNKIPDPLSKYQQSWRLHHPNWQFRFWTDEDMDKFIKTNYPKFLSIYNAYPQHIMRVDAFRYFLLYHYGGIYADMDFECLKPFDDLLTKPKIAQQAILLIPEPRAHLKSPKVQTRRFDYVVSNALMASSPKHPFWKLVVSSLMENKRPSSLGLTNDLLDITGPFMLTKVHNLYKPRLALADGEYFDGYYHDGVTTQKQQKQQHKLLEKQQTEQQLMYAQHHWAGSWWNKWDRSSVTKGYISLRGIVKKRIMKMLSFNHRIKDYIQTSHLVVSNQDNTKNKKEKSFCLVLERGKLVGHFSFKLKVSQSPQSEPKTKAKTKLKAKPKGYKKAANLMPPTHKVSALMLTKDRAAMAWQAVECFLNQSYENKELVIVESSTNKFESLGSILQEKGFLDSPQIRYKQTEQTNQPLGSLRNESIELARGEYVCIWDDDDLHHPDRISIQMQALKSAASDGDRPADACFLLRLMLMQDDADDLLASSSLSLAISDFRLWEGGMLAKKSIMPQYPHWKRGEDSVLNYKLVTRNKVVALDYPSSYIYRFHPSNTWTAKHRINIWQRASRYFFLADDLHDELARLSDYYPQLTKSVMNLKQRPQAKI